MPLVSLEEQFEVKSASFQLPVSHVLVVEFCAILGSWPPLTLVLGRYLPHNRSGRIGEERRRNSLPKLKYLAAWLLRVAA